MKKKILIIEDEEHIAQLLMRRLNGAEYEIIHCADGAKALNLIKSETFNLAYVDVMLPHVDGFTLTQALREENRETIILIVTALNSDGDYLQAYNLGADDYVTKPFSPKLLAAKMEALLKRRGEILPQSETFYHGIVFDDMAKSFTIEEQPLVLTPSEHHILLLLLQASKKVFSRDEITQHLYDTYDYQIDSRGIDTHIYQIRKKIALFSEASVIKTVRNMGYTIDED